MFPDVLVGIFIPFMGTVVGAAGVFFIRKKLGDTLSRILTGFAGGVMTAASVWSLLIPAINYSQFMGKWSFVPAAVGFVGGIVFLLLLDKLVPHLHRGDDCPEGVRCSADRNTMLTLAVALHNLPEGMAVGVIYAGFLAGDAGITLAAAVSLSLGIAIQNLPEGAIVSMPLHSEGVGRTRAFFYGVLSGIVEPLGTILTIAMASLVLPVLPYLLSFAAGAMIYVVIEELVPEMSRGKHSNVGTLAFAAGFTLMMILDVALG